METRGRVKRIYILCKVAFVTIGLANCSTTSPKGRSDQRVDEQDASSDSKLSEEERDRNIRAAEEQTLKDAQTLADSGQFLNAIEKAETIGASSPSYAKAQDKIRSFSNAGVHQLRQTAAVEFQAAMPTIDPRTKRAHLEKAEAALKEALEKYPRADTIPTVRDNLKVVQNEIKNLP